MPTRTGSTGSGEENIQVYANRPTGPSAVSAGSADRACYWRTRGKRLGDGETLFGLCAGAIDDLGDLKLTSEIYIDHKPAGYAFAGETEKKTQAEAEAVVCPAHRWRTAQ